MNDIWQQLAAGVIATIGLPFVAWAFSQIRNATAQATSRVSNEALQRLSEIIGVVIIDSGEVFTRLLVDKLDDGKLTPEELSSALDEAAQFAWSLMRNQDKKALAGTDQKLTKEFETILKTRIEAEARRALGN